MTCRWAVLCYLSGKLRADAAMVKITRLEAEWLSLPYCVKEGVGSSGQARLRLGPRYGCVCTCAVLTVLTQTGPFGRFPVTWTVLGLILGRSGLSGGKQNREV